MAVDSLERRQWRAAAPFSGASSKQQLETASNASASSSTSAQASSDSCSTKSPATFAPRRRCSSTPDSNRSLTMPSPDAHQQRWSSAEVAAPIAREQHERIQQLTARIRQTAIEAVRSASRLRSCESLTSRVAKLFASKSRQEKTQLKEMKMATEVAERHRSVAVLQTVRSLLIEVHDKQGNGMSRDRCTNAWKRRLLAGTRDADRVVATDSLHHVLERQARWFAHMVATQENKPSFQKSGLPAATRLQSFLFHFANAGDSACVPPAYEDIPSPALITFENLVHHLGLLKPALGRAFHRLCRDSMASLVQSSVTPESFGVRLWQDVDVRTALDRLIQELTTAIATEAHVRAKFLGIVEAFVEQMVFSRLAGVCYRSNAEHLDELNSLWFEQVAKTRTQSLKELGLRGVHIAHATPIFRKTIAAFNRMPYLIPSSVRAAFLAAIQTLFDEALDVLEVPADSLSADAVLPLLVYVLSRCDLPHLHTQAFLMKQFAIKPSEEGSEAAYYLACLDAAMKYIMEQ